jgi:hypothetical protein
MFDWTGVNWVAVIVAAVAGFIISFIWYLPQVFGNRWAAATGRSLPQLGQAAMTNYVIGVVIVVVVAYVLALVIDGIGATTVIDGVITAAVLSIGFYAVPIYSAVLWEGRTMTWWYITAGFAFVTSVVMGAVIGYFGPA